MLDFYVGSCRVQFHFLFLAALGIVLFTDLRETALSGILATAIHEGGHLGMMLLCRVPPKTVRIRPFGVLIQEQSGCRKTYLREILIALSGPFANGIVVAILFFTQWGSNLIQSSFFLTNLALGIFNCLPVESLDGGRALAAFLSPHIAPLRAERVVMTASLLTIIPMAIVGFLLLLGSHYNFSLLAASVYLMLCFVLKN